ncbi:hypothetical protein FACS189487_01160 [Campylobacterota bacterium]|nr:hypothetical protein FACS189487_01160 [Campylobacterota bacterium]
MDSTDAFYLYDKNKECEDPKSTSSRWETICKWETEYQRKKKSGK